jgi:hypothetical protein
VDSPPFVVVDYYPNKTADELLVILAGIQQRASTGALSMTTGSGLQQMRTWQGAARPEVEIRRVLFSLHKRDPETYQNPYNDRVRMARPAYT